MIFAFERLAAIANSRFHIGFYSDIRFRALSWYREFAFSHDSIVIFAFERLAGIANSRFHIGFYSDIRFRALSWYSEFAFSPRIL